MGCPSTFAAILLRASPIIPRWKLMLPLTPIAPLFVMTRQVEQDPFFKTIGVSSVFPRTWSSLCSAQLQQDHCTDSTSRWSCVDETFLSPSQTLCVLFTLTFLPHLCPALLFLPQPLCFPSASLQLLSSLTHPSDFFPFLLLPSPAAYF